ncbi:MAG: ABC transporter ATP-binding protein [Spirochaetaceae bacterium]
MSAILTATGLYKHFGGVKAVDGVSFEVEEGSSVSLIGPNGAGKTTVFNVLSGINALDKGEVYLAGARISGLKQHQVSIAGLGRTFQNIRLFQGLTVAENVMAAMDARARHGFWESVLRLPRFSREEQEHRGRVQEYLEALGISRYANARPSELSYGYQRRVELARALACSPRVILLDEPAAGLNPGEVGTFIDLLNDLKERYDLTLFIIEHRMQLVMSMSSHVYVMNFGQLIAEGTPEEIQRDPVVIKAYIGEANATN